ncbi:MAG TPA: hypothetical protein VFS04_03155 [Alphaproteobacteria bacterium]|nr:hypothetical protein [Alphaproteobacteria bacterium]
MMRRPRQTRDAQDVAGRIEPRFAARDAQKEQHAPAVPASSPPTQPPQAEPAPAPALAPATPNPNPYALPEHVIPAWVARPSAPQATTQAEAKAAQTPHEPRNMPPRAAEPPAPTADARARESYWSKIHVPDEERDRAAKAGLYRYVKEAAAHETPRKAPGAPPRPMSAAGDGKPRIWLTVIALLLLFGAGAYGLSQLADAPYGKQNAEWRPAETAQPTAPSAPQTPDPAPAPTPSFIEVAP